MNLPDDKHICLYILEVLMFSCKNGTVKLIGNMAVGLGLVFMLCVPAITKAAGDVIVPEGTRISLQLNDNLSTKTNSEGDSFKAIVTIPVYLGDRVIIPKGSIVNGSISRITRPGRFKGKASMSILFQSVSIPGRGQLPIIASLDKVDSEGTADVRSEGTIVGKGSAGSDIGRILKPGAVGTGIGGLAGGGKGAGIGAGVGAAAGLATVFATRGKDLEVHRGATMDMLLDRPLVIPFEGDGTTAKIRN
jgi:hypothetical protein